MTGTYDEADYLSSAPRGVRQKPAWRRLGLPIAGIVLVCGGTAAAIGLMTDKVYEAETRIELIVPEAADPASMPLAGTRLAKARSSEVASTAVTTAGLLGNSRFLDENPVLDGDGLSQADRQTRAAGAVLRNTGTELDEDGAFATITYRASTPALAADVADALAAAFVEADRQNVAAALGDTREELEELVATVREELELAERSLTSGMTEADILALPASEAELVGGPTSAGSDALSEDARVAISTQIALVRRELDRVEGEIAEGALDRNDPVIRQLLESRGELEAEYRRVTEQFRADYPGAQQLRRQIETIDETLTRESLRLAEDRAQEQAQLTRQEQDLLGQLAELGGEVAARGEAGEGVVDLQAEVQAKRELYSLLLARLALTQDEELPTTARVISPAELPTSPVTPNWYWLIGGAAGIALLLSLALLAWDARRRRLYY